MRNILSYKVSYVWDGTFLTLTAEDSGPVWQINYFATGLSQPWDEREFGWTYPTTATGIEGAEGGAESPGHRKYGLFGKQRTSKPKTAMPDLLLGAG